MNKKFIIISLLFVGLLFTQTSTQAQTQDPLPVLPSAGITPNNPLYFLERAIEAIGEFLTFDTERKAKLQAERALERIAEIKTMLAEKEINPKGLNVAIDKLQANIAKAAEIIQQEREKGENVSTLAKELDTNFEIRERLLKQILGEKEDRIEIAFKQQKTELKKQLLDAKLTGDLEKVDEIKIVLDNIEQEKESQKFLLEQKKEELKLAFEIEEEKFELALEEKEREFELKEKEVELAFEQKKEELKGRFEEAERALELEEGSLEDQLDIALSLEDAEDIENIRTQLLAIGIDASSLDSKFEDSEQELEEVERNFELLILKEERDLEDFVQQEELALKKSEVEIEKAFKEKEFALEKQFKAQESELKIQEKKLEFQISEARQACELVIDTTACFIETVAPLKESLVQMEIKKQQLEIEEKQAEQALGIEERQIEQALEFKEKELELKEEKREQALETKEEGFERLQGKRDEQLEGQDEEAGRDGEEDKQVETKQEVEEKD